MRKEAESIFPDPRDAGEDGLLCYGGDLSIETLLDAYQHGIFPWPQEGLPVLWFSPAERGILEFSEIRWSRRFLREMKARKYHITFNQAFAQVIAECARSKRKPGHGGTWILPEMEEAYTELHRVGHAHSVECWNADRELVGGLYGVYVAGVFSGESMYFKESGASKRCLYALVAKLRDCGLQWMDIQMVTPVLSSIGGKYISREEFLERLHQASMAPRQIRFTEGDWQWL